MTRAPSARRSQHAVVSAVLGLGLAATGAGIANITPTPNGTPNGTPRATTQAITATAAAVVPDPKLHPGAVDRTLTKTRLCSDTFHTSDVRPNSSFTGRLKRLQLADGGTITTLNFTYTVVGEHIAGEPADYEEDHLIALELGGAPHDPRNLWPEPWERRGAGLAPAGTGAESKDKVENRLHDEVCAGTMSLKAAQHKIATAWTTAG